MTTALTHKEGNNKTQIIYILVGLLVVAAFALGSLYQKVKFLEGGGSTVKGTDKQTVTPAGQEQTQQAPQISIDQIRETYNKSLVKFGDKNKKIIFIEVADPSCPYCHIAAGQNSELNKQVGDRFKLVKDGGTYLAPVPEMKKLVDQGKAAFAWVYQNGHGNGEMGTKAMYCAFEKGKFWEVHDKLMTNEGYNLLNETVQNNKDKSKELAIFLKSVFDTTTMQECLDSGKYDERLTTDATLAVGIGVQGTPGFYINDKLFAGAYSYKDMEEMVDAALK